jgi:hypothetical protein
MSHREKIRLKSMAGGRPRRQVDVARLYQPNRENLRLLVERKKGPNFRKPRKKK